MNTQKMAQFISFKKAFFIALLVFSFSIIFVDSAKAADWKKTPAQCPSVYEGYGQTGGPGEGMCGVLSNTALWFSTSSLVLLVPTSSTSTNNTPGVNLGGYVVDCQAYDANPLPDGPFCDNNTNFWCSPSTTCSNAYRKTECVAGKWAIESGATNCSSCQTNRWDCDGNSTCEVLSGGACSADLGGKIVSGVWQCTAGTDCSDLGGNTRNCSCIPSAQNFQTGVEARFITTSPLLWGTQYGTGDLINITRNGNATSSFVVFNSGQVAIGHNINVSTTSVAFEVSSTERGILIPRLGGNPTNGIDGELYYDSIAKKFKYYNGSAWSDLGGGSSWATTTLLSVSGNATGLYPAGTVSTTIGIGSTGTDIWLQTSSTPRIYVAENGNVGIGTVTPTEKLSVVGNISNLITSQSGIRKISSVNVGAFSSDIHVSGKYAYVTNRNSNSISVVDISNPSTPIQISTTSVGSRPSAIYVFNKYAYVTNQDSNSISVVDISNPSVPVQISATSVESYPNDIYVSGKYAYVINQNSSSISVVDISNPYSPIQISTTSVGYNPRSIYISGKYAYIIKNEASANISVVDISNPYLPTQIYSGDIDPYPESIYVSGNYAYTVNAFGSISIININNPYLPVQISTTNVGASPVSVYVSGKYAYVTNYASDFVSVVDISNPSSPIQVSTTSVGYNMRAIYVSGRYAYATHYNAVGSVSVIDLTGTEVSSLIAHSAEVGNLQIGNDLSAKGTADFGSLSIGIGGILSNGPISVMATNSPSYFGGNVGIGTTSPIFKLTLGEDGGIYSAWPNYTPLGSLGGAVLPSTSSGTLMFWYPRKAAFRAGVIDKSQPNSDAWNENNIGPLSFSFGGNNVASATGTFVVGVANTSSGQYSSITGGMFNNMTGNVSFIGGGSNNNNSGSYSFIGAGRNNTASELYSFVGGGQNNTSSNDYSVVVGGRNNLASGEYSFVGGGQNNTSSNVYSFIGGGAGNIASGRYSFIGGGSSNNVTAAWYSTIVGGEDNTASGDSSFVGGGISNTASGYASFVGGGGSNTASGSYSFIGGGAGNIASGQYSSVFGQNMKVYGGYSFGINLSATENTVNESNTMAIMGGNVGIGTTSPSGILHTVSPGFSTVPIFERSATVNDKYTALKVSARRNVSSADGMGPGIDFISIINSSVDPYGNISSNSSSTVASIAGLLNGSSSSTGRLAFYTNNEGSLTEKMTIDNNGNVGIGTSTPQEKLSVVGNISNLITKQSGVKIIATESVESSPRSIDIFGNYAYIANHNSNTISIVDISNPYLPVQISTTSVGTWPNSIRVSGKYVYVINRNSNNLYVVDVSNPSSPTTVSVTNVSSSPLSIYISGKYAYIAHSTSNKISVIDISNPYYPIVVSSITTGNLSNNPRSIYVSGNYAYVSGGTNNTFLVFDISNPYSPIQISSISMFGLPGSIYVSGKYAYVASSNASSIGIIDISNPYSPNIISNVTVGTNPNSIYVSGRYAYVANGYTNNISVVDVSNPYLPIQISTTSVSSSPEAIHVSGRYAYVANSDSNKISVIDITGTEVSSLVAHSSEIGNLQVRNNIVTQGFGQFGSLNVGAGGLLVNGSLSVSATNSPSYFGGSVGVGIINPLAKLHLAGDGAILATGTMYGSGWDGGTLGAGSRLMWIPSKGAFRAGYVYGSEWNNTNIGNSSVAFGESNTASGYLSTVLGGSGNTISSGFGVIIGGSNNQISGISSLIFGGSYNSVTGTNSMAFGRYMNITGNYSFGVNVSASTNKVYLSDSNVVAFVGGNVGIGTTSPKTLLDITGSGPEVRIYDNNASGRNPKLSFVRGTVSSTFGGDLYTDWRLNGGEGTDNDFTFESAASGVITTRVRFGSGGGAEIGGPITFPGLNSGSGVFVCINNTTGLLYKASSACSYSDNRLKTDIISMVAEKNVLESLNQMRGVYYYWNTSTYGENDGRRQIGVIAQELELVLPELVYTDASTTYKSVDYPRLTAFLIEVAKAQQIEIESLHTAVSTTLSVQQSGGQLTYSGGDLDLQNYSLLNVKNITGTDNKWAIDENGQFITRIQTSGGNTKEMFAMQSPYSEFVFSSSSELINGEAIINFDPDTCELIDETQPLKVNITLTGECGGIFVKEKSATGFIVKELGGGNSSSTFDWMVIAKRKFATTSPQSSPSQGEEDIPSPLEGEGEDEVEIPSTLEGEGEGEVVTTTPPAEAEPLTEQSSGDGEPTTTPEIPPEPPAEAEPLTEQSSGDGEETPPAEETP